MIYLSKHKGLSLLIFFLMIIGLAASFWLILGPNYFQKENFVYDGVYYEGWVYDQTINACKFTSFFHGPGLEPLPVTVEDCQRAQSALLSRPGNSLVAGLTAVVLPGNFAALQNQTNQWQTLSTSKWSMSIPPGWQVGSCHACAADDSDSSTITEIGNNDGLGSGGMSLDIKSISLYNQTETGKKFLDWSYIIKERGISQRGPISIGVIQGDMMVYPESGNNEFEAIQFNHGDDHYVIRFGSYVNNYDGSLRKLTSQANYPIYRQMISTFKFIQ